MKKTLRTIIVMVVLAAMVIGMGTVALAAGDKTFKFMNGKKVDYNLTYDDVFLWAKSAKKQVSLRERVPELFLLLNVPAIARSVAYDRFSNEWNPYNPELVRASDDNLFDYWFDCVGCPDYVVVPDYLVPVTVEGDALVFIVPIGVDVGETFTVKWGKVGEEGIETEVKVEDPGRAVLVIDHSYLDGCEDGDEFFFDIVYKDPATGKEIAHHTTLPFVSEIPTTDRADYPSGNKGGNGGGNGGNGEGDNGRGWGFMTHGVAININGKLYGVKVAPDRGIFWSDVWMPVWGEDSKSDIDGLSVEVWANNWVGNKSMPGLVIPLSRTSVNEVLGYLGGFLTGK